MDVIVSVIIPVHNAEQWLRLCLNSIVRQNLPSSDQTSYRPALLRSNVQISVYFDGCTDGSLQVWNGMIEDLTAAGFQLVSSQGSPARGVGYAKNRAVDQSCGEYLCFLDADDEMTPCRIACQYELALRNHNAIVGGRFTRTPVGSTARYTRWSNNLTAQQLSLQTLTSHGPTVIMPTWFMHRAVFHRAGGFDERGAGVPEDLIFFHAHLDAGGQVLRASQHVIIYRYHLNSASFSVHESTIWQLRVSRLVQCYLEPWLSGNHTGPTAGNASNSVGNSGGNGGGNGGGNTDVNLSTAGADSQVPYADTEATFSIWNAGRQGRRLYRSLPAHIRRKVACFYDVDTRKIARSHYTPHMRHCRRASDKSDAQCSPVPIVHFSAARPPLVVCVKLDLSGGEFERNLASLRLAEGLDYVMFS